MRYLNFFLREDPQYDHDCKTFQARSPGSQALYLFLHLAPGIAGYLLINIVSIYEPLKLFSGLSDRNFQYLLFILVTYLWHIALPFAVLRWVDKLSLRESCRFLGLDRCDWRGLLIVLPVIFIPYTFISIPWFLIFVTPLEDLLGSVPAFRIPDHSIFAGDLYEFPMFMLLFLFVGNFLGEELYYRGYLMKKCAFLGRHTWWITSIFFALYHLWQIPQTWPLILPVLIFGAVMALRKDLYVAVALHFILNLIWLPFMFTSFVK